MPATPMWCARSSGARRASAEPADGRARGVAAAARAGERKRGRRCALRRRRASSCRSILASAGHAIGGENVKVYLFVATLGYSRRLLCAGRSATSARRAGLRGWKARSATLAGSPRRCCSTTTAGWSCGTTATTREVEFNARLHAFAKHWGFRPRACAPYRARTKGKDERGVGYVKRNAIAGRSFESWAALEAHLDGLDARCRRPAGARHDRRGADRALPARRGGSAAGRLPAFPPFEAARELVRKVQADCAIEVDGNAYSVPWRLIGETVRVIDRRRRAARQPCRPRGRGSSASAPAASNARRRSAALRGRRRLPVPSRCQPAGSRRHGASELLRPLLEYERCWSEERW